MRWIRSHLHSISGWLTPSAPLAMASPQQLDALRGAMLAALGAAGAARRPRLAARIRCSFEADTLWHLRGELMDCASQLYGETRARALLAGVTTLFDGLIPHAYSARVSPPRARVAAWRHH
ncbi:MAG: hypothetical protein JWQ07_1947 [Ramlibacter sp.]|nr:hypothetical protein [Ramlibacter sp.]